MKKNRITVTIDDETKKMLLDLRITSNGIISTSEVVRIAINELNNAVKEIRNER